MLLPHMPLVNNMKITQNNSTDEPHCKQTVCTACHRDTVLSLLSVATNSTNHLAEIWVMAENPDFCTLNKSLSPYPCSSKQCIRNSIRLFQT
jgi:hypothetical protein